ncbi:MAG: hypothetical protein K0S45_3911 [Nitrospira sp.]|jgi:hypothetical protein|nr:hypothetical protein [Nitrospira sp.]
MISKVLTGLLQQEDRQRAGVADRGCGRKPPL